MTRKMKDSGIEWIGEIPEDWQTIRVKNLFDVSRGRVISKLEITDDGKYPVYSSQTENDGIFGYIDTFDYSGEALTWTTDGEKAGTVFYRNGKYNCTNICGILEKKQDSIYKTDIKYLFYAIRMVAEENKRPDTNGHKIMSNEMERLSIPITNYDEQVKISLTLDEKSRNIDNTLNLIKEEIESLENYKKSVITEAVTKGLDMNVEMKDSGIEWIGEIPKHWEIIRLKYGLTEKMKYGASEEGVEFSETLPRYIRITDIDQNGNLKSTGKQSLPENKSVGYILEDNTVLFARSGATVGKTFLYKKEYGRSAYAGYLIAAKTNNIILLGIWLYYFTFSDAYYNWTRQMFSQSKIQNINAEKYSNMPLPITGISNQLKIIDYLNKKTKLIDDSIAIKRKQLETLEEYKKSLIYEYVTGKKEVNDGEES